MRLGRILRSWPAFWAACLLFLAGLAALVRLGVEQPSLDTFLTILLYVYGLVGTSLLVAWIARLLLDMSHDERRSIPAHKT